MSDDQWMCPLRHGYTNRTVGDRVLSWRNTTRAPGAALVEATETLDSSFDRITAVVGGLLERLQSLPAGPERAEVQFGLKLGVEAGLIIARGTAEVNFQVTLSWQRDRG